MSLYYSIKRKISRIGCLLGRHNYKMGVSAKGGGSFGCLWCQNNIENNTVLTQTGIPYVEGYQGMQGTQGQSHQPSDLFLSEAERQVRRLFKGKM